MNATHTLFCILFSIITPISTIETKPPAEPPLIYDHPFVAIWSAPTSNCRKHEILLDFAAFSAVTTPALVPDQFLITYYEPRLGLYPRIHSQTGMSFEGGIPQNGSLEEHLKKVKSQIPETLTNDSSGLVVIDWESWRPLWDRNWGSKKIYRDRSIDHARKINQSLAQQDLIKLAKRQFEEAGRNFMVKTISLGIIERPCRLWGFYLFPDCYNYGWEEPGYTGRCSEKTKWQNDQLLWLWEKSRALFPSVYISQSLGNSTFAKLYVRNRVQEAMRVAELPQRPHTVPVYVYSRPLFRDQSSTFLSQVRHFICSTNDRKERLKSDSELLGPVSDGPGQHSGRDCSRGSFRCGHVGLQHRLRLKGKHACSYWSQLLSQPILINIQVCVVQKFSIQLSQIHLILCSSVVM